MNRPPRYGYGWPLVQFALGVVVLAAIAWWLA